jgi:hypothetical protein
MPVQVNMKLITRTTHFLDLAIGGELRRYVVVVACIERLCLRERKSAALLTLISLQAQDHPQSRV